MRSCRVCSRSEGDVNFSGPRLICNPCRGKDYYARNREKAIAAVRKRYWVKRDEIQAQKSRRNRENPDLRRDESYRSKYGITLADYERMYVEQDGGCRICDMKLERLSVDHCHTTGRVRGLLCPECNTGLGYFRDDTELMSRAIDYLSPSLLREIA